MNLINPNVYSVTAFAPATCANVAVGFDILGFALDKIGDKVTLTRRDDNQIIIEKIEPADAHETIPRDTNKNTASVVIQKICQELNLNIGFSIHIQKGIPLSSGLGGSAASAVAALVALNAFLKVPLSSFELLRYALYGEEIASGQKHADNIAPCLLSGLTLVHSLEPLEIIQLPIPNVYCVLIYPCLQVPTKQARSILKQQLSLIDYVKQSANLAAFISALYKKDITILKKSLTDILIEPQRAQFVPGFYKIKSSALAAGALGVSFSGSGPSLFAFAENKIAAENIMHVMQDQIRLQNIDSKQWISRISKKPARILSIVKG